MTPIDKRILGFIAGHHVLTLAVAKDNIPYCAHCFYAYIPGKNRFIFTSDPDTRHIRDAESSRNFYVTAGIALETKIIGKIRGLQLTGKMFLPEGEDLKDARKAYLSKFPYAALVKLHLWVLEPGFMKLTDNRLGFGKKVIWEECSQTDPGP
jgi:uncharacterized protein YhbP (UPF0306 family)